MRIEFFNFDEIFDPNRICTNPDPLTKDRTYSPDGICSEEIFGKQTDIDTLSYSCKCGKYKGKFLEGFICSDCNTAVSLQKDNLENYGWVDLGKYYIISPIFYHLINKLTGKLNNIISYDKKITRDGNIIEENSTSKLYDNVGLVYFKENFFEGEKILNYLYKNSKNKDKDLIYNLLIKEKDKVFINKFPIYDVKLRPSNITKGDSKSKPIYRFDEVDNNYNFMIKYSNIINKESADFKLLILPNLFNIQNKANLIFDKIIENLAGKSGFIRSSLLGNRLNMTSRTVITPLPAGHDICDIVIPYVVFIELYSFQLMHLLSKYKNISIIESRKILFNAKINFNEEVYNLCNDLINKTEGGLMMLGDRNPTIARGSMLCHKVAGIKKDITDLTTSLHNCVLTPLGGDYDGDVYNLFVIYDRELKEKFFETFSPERMLISNNDGKFNSKLGIERDQVIGIRQFVND